MPTHRQRGVETPRHPRLPLSTTLGLELLDLLGRYQHSAATDPELAALRSVRGRAQRGGPPTFVAPDKDGRLKLITDAARMSITYQVAIYSTGRAPP